MASNAPATTPPMPKFDPLRATWRLLTNVKFAVALVTVAVLASLIGVVLPAAAGGDAGQPARALGLAGAPARGLRLADRRPRRARPVRRVPQPVVRGALDRDRGGGDGLHDQPLPADLAERAAPADAGERCAISRRRGTGPRSRTRGARRRWRGCCGRRRYYIVTRTHEDEGVTELFAERFPWTQYATFVSHLALLLLLVGGAADEPGGVPADAGAGGGAAGGAALRRPRSGADLRGDGGRPPGSGRGREHHRLPQRPAAAARG